MLYQSVQAIAHSLRFFGAFAIAPAAFEAGFGGGCDAVPWTPARAKSFAPCLRVRIVAFFAHLRGRRSAGNDRYDGCHENV